jgi:hypothetical protein
LDCQKLEAAIIEFGNNWAKVSQIIGRTTIACQKKAKMMFFFGQYEDPERKCWTDEETQKLMDLLLTHGEKNWELISQILGRTIAACKHKAIKLNFVMR